jgi:hypothetical protein
VVPFYFPGLHYLPTQNTNTQYDLLCIRLGFYVLLKAEMPEYYELDEWDLILVRRQNFYPRCHVQTGTGTDQFLQAASTAAAF